MVCVSKRPTLLLTTKRQTHLQQSIIKELPLHLFIVGYTCALTVFDEGVFQRFNDCTRKLREKNIISESQHKSAHGQLEWSGLPGVSPESLSNYCQWPVSFIIVIMQYLDVFFHNLWCTENLVTTQVEHNFCYSELWDGLKELRHPLLFINSVRRVSVLLQYQSDSIVLEN